MKLKSPALSILMFFVVLGVFSWFIKPVFAVEYQNCSTSANCTIGEFLYDDSYAPDATASCTLVSRYPNGNAFLSPPVAMIASSSGWYSYTATIGTTEGVYPSQICCTTASSEYLCLDKTFKVVAPTTVSGGATAAEVWNYSDRSLTSFGTLVADIWNYSTRSLTNFGTLVTDIWSRDSRTLTSTDSANIVTNIIEIREMKSILEENRVALEQLINKPIVKTFIDESPIPNLTAKLEQTKTAAANLYSGIQNLKSRSLLLKEKWPTLSESEVKSELTTLSAIFQQDINQKDTNILATATWLKTSWNSPILLSLSDEAQTAQGQLKTLLGDLTLYRKGTKSEALDSVLRHIEKLDELIGTSLATSTDLNLFGFIKKTNEQIALYDVQTAEGIKILTEIKNGDKPDQTAAITKLSNDILASNQVPQVDTFFAKSIKKTNTPTNKVLGLLAVVDTNRLMLAGNTGQALKFIWLEEGSIIFRSVATNPSHSVTQKVMVKYYLPTELKKEQIIKYDPELSIDYDPIENALYASGEITLSPQETRTFLVEVEDIWNFKQEEIDSLKNQVNELTAALKNTSSFAQATSIKSDIVVTLDRIMLRQKEAVTPENRIQSFRESSLEMNGVEEKINSLKELIVRSNGAGGMFGFIGNIQTVTLWGIVLIVIAGFAFLIMYLNALRSEARLKKDEQKEVVEDALKEHDNIYHPLPKYRHRETHKTRGHKIARIASVALLAGGLSSLGASIAIKASQNRTMALNPLSETKEVLGTNAEKKFPYLAELKIPDGGVVPVRSAPTLSSQEIKSFKDNQAVFVFKIVGIWAQIGLSDKDIDSNWWVNLQYLDIK